MGLKNIYIAIYLWSLINIAFAFVSCDLGFCWEGVADFIIHFESLIMMMITIKTK